MVETDEKGGHDNGWMSEKYLECVSTALDNVKKVIDALGDRYTVIVTADHGATTEPTVQICRKMLRYLCFSSENSLNQANISMM